MIMEEPIIDNEFIIAEVAFDDDELFEWDAKTEDTNKIINSLILEIKVLRDIVELKNKKLKFNSKPEFYNLNP